MNKGLLHESKSYKDEARFPRVLNSFKSCTLKMVDHNFDQFRVLAFKRKIV
jgi:hypothetical protein